MQEAIFDIGFEYGGKLYKGWVNPSEKINESGKPESFHVVLNDTSFGYLSLKECKWLVNEPRPEGIVKAAGKEIEKHYML
jgi:hypothetical protein